MAASTVAYSDTRGNRDYTSIIASQIGRRLKEASDMASEERAFAAKKAEEGGTSLEEAGIGKGYFFKRALGSRFGGDAIARTKGRMGVSGPGTNPATNYKQRFRGGFDYNVTNQVSNISDTAPLSNAVVQGLNGVEYGLVKVSSAIERQGQELGKLSKVTADMAKATMLNGYLFQMFNEQQKRQAGRSSLAREESSLEGGFGGRRRGGQGGMINVTPPPSDLKGSSDFSGLLRGADTFQTGAKLAFNDKGAAKFAKAASGTAGAVTGGLAKLGIKAPRKIAKKISQTALRLTSSRSPLKTAAKVLAGDNSSTIVKPVKKLAQKTGVKITRGMGDDGAERLMKAIADTADVDQATKFALGISEAGMDEQLLIRALSKKGDKLVPKEEAMKTFANLVDDGVNPKVADKFLKRLYGPDQYKRLLDGAGDPIRRLMQNTFTNKMFKAPAIDKIIKTSTKTAAKTTGKHGLKSLAKKIPVIAGLAGIAFGIQRAMDGDLLGAGLEITSGLLGAISPFTGGFGTGLSYGIDGFLLARDLGMMPPGLRTGGRLGNFPANSFISVNGMPVAKMNEAGGGGSSEQIEVKPNDPKQFVKEGKGLVQAIYEDKQKFASAMSLGVEKGMLNFESRGNIFDFIGDFFDGNNEESVEELEAKGIIGDKNFLQYRDGRKDYENQGWDFLNMIPDNWFNRKKDFQSESGAAWKKRRKDDSANLTPEQVYDDSHLLNNGQPNAMGTQIGDYVGEGLIDLGPVPVIINQNIYNQGSGDGANSMSEEIYGTGSEVSFASDFYRSYSIMSKV